MIFSYEITRRPADLGGGCNLRLLRDGVEMGGGVFPLDAYAYAENEEVAEQEAYNDATSEGEAWANKADRPSEIKKNFADESEKYFKWQLAQDILQYMQMIRRNMIFAEEDKPSPDLEKIRQWREEKKHLFEEEKGLKINDLALSLRVIEQYGSDSSKSASR